MVSKSIMAAIAIVVILVIGGGIYMTQQPPASTPTITPTTPKPAATTPAETPTTPEAKTLTSEEETEIKDVVMNYFDTFNQRSVEENVACFTKDGVKLGISGADTFTVTGHDEIRVQLTGVFKSVPDVSLENIVIEVLHTTEDIAYTRAVYSAVSKTEDWKRPMFDEINLVKVDGIWKIARAETLHLSDAPVTR